LTLARGLLIGLNALLLASGQLIWKLGLQRRGDAFASLRGIVRLLLSPYVLIGLGIYGVATVLWLYILSRVPLSIAYPLQSAAYIVTLLGAFLFFREPLSVAKIGGCLLVVAGISLIGWKG